MKTVISLLVATALVIALAGCTEPSESADDSTPQETSAETDGGQDSQTETGEEDYSHLLTPADVESVTGMSGLVVVPYDPTVGAGGEVNIADSAGELVVMVSTSPGLWDGWQGDGMTVGEPSSPTVGDESFLGPKDASDEDAYILGFRKGDKAAAVVAFFSVGFERTLTLDQMHELATIVESRL